MKKRLEKTGQNTEEVEAKIAANNRIAKQIDRENNDDIQTLEELNEEYRTTMLSLPNIPDKDLTSEDAESEIIYSTAAMHSFDFQPVHYFELCEKLTAVELGRSTSILETRAFYGFQNLEEIDLKNVTKLDDFALAATGLKTADIPSCVISIGIYSEVFMHFAVFCLMVFQSAHTYLFSSTAIFLLWSISDTTFIPPPKASMKVVSLSRCSVMIGRICLMILFLLPEYLISTNFIMF
jgi:hypothetical protein